MGKREGCGCAFVGCMVYIAAWMMPCALLVARLVRLDWGEWFSLGQLCIDAIGFPAVAAGLVYTLSELRKAQKHPDVDLYWQPAAQRMKDREILVWQSGWAAEGIQLELLNTGQAIGLWYQVQIEFPVELLPLAARLHFFRLISGDEANWRWASPSSESPGSNVIYAFQSNGQVALYPYFGQILAEWGVHSAPGRDMYRVH